MALAHPNLVLRILSDTATVAAAAATANESLYAALEASGLPAHDVVRGADVIVDFVHGVVLAEADAATNDPAALAASRRRWTSCRRRTWPFSAGCWPTPAHGTASASGWT